MKRPSHLPIRLLAESLFIVALAQVAVLASVHWFAPAGQRWQVVAMCVAALVLLAAPTLYWRAMQAVRQAANLGVVAEGSTVDVSSWERRRARAIGMTGAAQLIGLLLTGAAVAYVTSQIEEDAHTRFDRHVERLETEVLRKFQQPIYGLQGARGVYAVNHSVNRALFRSYVESRDLATEFPGVRGFGFVQRVLRKDLDQFLDEVRAEGPSDFNVRTSGQAEDLYIVKYIEPFSQNFPAWGYDMGSEGVRREAIERAVASAEPSLTGQLVLGPGKRKAPGFIYLVPIYRQGADPTTDAQRKQALVGLVYAPMFAADLFGGMGKVTDGALEFELFNGDGTHAAQLAFASTVPVGDAEGVITSEAYADHMFSAVRTLAVGGRLLTLRASSSPAFEAAVDRRPIVYVGVGGSLLSLLLALVVWALASARMRAQRFAERMTVDLDRLAQVVRHTSNAVFITDRELRIQWINEGFTRISGYDIEAARGKTPGELLGSGKAAPDTLEQLSRSAAAGLPCRVEILNRSREGREYWVDTEIQPLRNAQGEVTGFMEIATDITDKRAAHEALQTALDDNNVLLQRAERDALALARERQRLDDILSGTNAGTWEWNAQTGVTIINERWAGMLGYTMAELAPVTFATWESTVHPDDLGPAHLALQAHVEGRSDQYDCELRMRHKSGHWVWVQTRGRISTRSTDGRPEWVAGTHLDISAAKQAAAAVQESEHMMRLVMDNIPGRLTYFDRQRRLTFANRASYEFYGGSPATSFGTDFVAFVGESAAAGQVARVDAVLAGQAQSYDFVRELPQGGKAYSVVHLVPDTRDGAVAGFIGMAIDVTAVKRAEQEVRRAEALLRGAIDAANAAFVLYDADDRLVFCNDQYRALHATSADLIVPGQRFEHMLRQAAERGQYPQALDDLDDWVAKRVAEHRRGDTTLEQCLDNGRWLRVIEHRMPDGHTVGFHIDITDLKNASAAAEAASRSKSQFLANMSHEIRTPMNAILGMLKLLQRTELTTRQLDYADKTERAARALLGLLNDILDFSKVEAGKMALEQRPFQLDQLLRDLSVILSANLGSKAVEVLFDVDPAVPAVLVGDDMRLQQVLVNLGGNAIKFTEQGEIVVGVRLLERSPAEVELAFSVRDTGIGIAPEHQRHIFDGFSQAEASTTRRFGGTGLGLSICQRLVGLMGGSIELESAPGQGSCFRFAIRLPVAVQPELVAASPELVTMRALVVDDNPLARSLIASMAQSQGWQVDLAADGSEALRRVAERDAAGEPYQAVLVDWQMPGMDGWETSRQIRERSSSRTPLLLMVTAQGREKLAQRAPDEQALLDGFLVKPVTASMLGDAIRHAQRRGGAGLIEAGGPSPDTNTRRLNGLRLLVVEDNANNQQVARELLEAEGASVALANDGEQGVAAVVEAANPFDVVLMDVQMPVMDGYTATARIRQHLGLQDLPIIAMTANAMASDHAASLAAGMNDHVGKPFDLDALVATLLKHVRRPIVPVLEALPGPATSTPIPAAVLQEAERLGIDLAVAVRRLGGRLDVWQRTTSAFVVELPARAREFERLMRQARHGDAGRLMHTLKGVGATLGARSLAQMAAAAEQALEGHAQGDAGVSSLALAPLLDVIAETTRDLGDLVTRLAPAPVAVADAGQPRDARTLVERVQPLRALLEQSDMAATDVHDELLQACEAHWGEELQPLSTAMAALDFDAALQACDQLLQIWSA